jgi:probable rRNA maturation factor
MLDIKNTTRQKMPANKAKFLSIKNDILGKNYELSLVFIGDQKSKKLNWQFRKKKYIPNVLSFPIDKNMGEIFINLKQAKKENTDSLFLFIHGCLHLKGHKHGKEMEKLEDKYFKKYK